MVDAEKVEGNARLPFGLRGVNKQKKVSMRITCGPPISTAT